jgi:hypothetical protein
MIALRLMMVVGLAAGLASPAASAVDGAGNFTLVNGTNGAITSVAIRRTGTAAWRPLSYAASPGGRAMVQFSDPDCAFDIRADVAGAQLVWAGVNLCEAKVVTLNRNASGLLWADYD